jgi:uncharacterized protein (TIGR02145 family)
LVHSIEEIFECAKLQKPCCCYYDFDIQYEKYGLLYNWYAVVDERGLAPSGYSVANHEDVELLQFQLSQMNDNPDMMEENVVKRDVLFAKTEFNPVAAGHFYIEPYVDAYFEDIDIYAWYWTSSNFEGEENAPVFHLSGNYIDPTPLAQAHEISISLNLIDGADKGSMPAVRCVRR